MAMVIVLILNIPGTVFAVIGNVLMWVAVILTIVSLVDYVVKNKDVLKDTK
jgi:CDP-diacylglycerol--glycerol-3-phosphate 3-phosphatidyltransferase